MEALLHFVLPLLAFTLLGVKPRKAFPLALLGVLPDLDVLFLVHRSLSHSLIIIGLASFPFFLLSFVLKPRTLRTVWLGFLSVASHPILDLFSGYTPILWPLHPYSLWVEAGLDGFFGSGVRFQLELEVHQIPTVFHRRVMLDAPLFTGPTLIASLVLLTPLIYRMLKESL